MREPVIQHCVVYAVSFGFVLFQPAIQLGRLRVGYKSSPRVLAAPLSVLEEWWPGTVEPPTPANFMPILTSDRRKELSYAYTFSEDPDVGEANIAA